MLGEPASADTTNARRARFRFAAGSQWALAEVRELIATRSREHVLWGTERLRGEWLNLGLVVSHRPPRAPARRIPAFLGALHARFSD